MALTEAQKVTVAEITRETYSLIDSLASSLNASQETSIVADIALWNTERNDVDFNLNSDGVKLEGVNILNAIRERVRKMFGLSLYSSEVQSGSVSIPTRAVF